MAKIKKEKIVPAVKNMKGLERKYTKELNRLGRQLIKSVRENVLVFLKAQEPAYISDSIATNLNTIFTNLNREFTGVIVAGFAEQTASGMVNTVSQTNQQRFNRTINRATGINLGAIATEEGIEDFITLQINKNVGLIKSLPEEYLKQVETIVNNGVLNGEPASSIAKKISARAGSANKTLANRIKTIARNEVQTVNAQISKRRTEALGVTEGIWRTAEDERVRGNPGGLYPNAKPSHFKANGQRFELKKGLKVDGQFIFPGIPINCRCTFSPVIEVQ